MRSPFVTFEGGEGAGKSTQVKALAAWMAARHIPHILTREPGGSEGAEAIRALLVQGRPDRWDAFSEGLLHTAARHDHVKRTIEPALAKGQWVLCDRFYDSTFVYQGYGRGLSLDFIEHLNNQAVGATHPDLTFIFDVPVEIGLKRAAARRRSIAGFSGDRYEKMDKALHERIREGFLIQAKKDPSRYVVIDAAHREDAIAERIQGVIMERWMR